MNLLLGILKACVQPSGLQESHRVQDYVCVSCRFSLHGICEFQSMLMCFFFSYVKRYCRRAFMLLPLIASICIYRVVPHNPCLAAGHLATMIKASEWSPLCSAWKRSQYDVKQILLFISPTGASQLGFSHYPTPGTSKWQQLDRV